MTADRPTTSWLRGVAANPAAPSEVLLRLLAVEGRTAWTVLCGERGLPPDVVDAVIAHPEVAVRRAFARNPHAAPGQRGRLATDADSLVRADLAAGPRPRPDAVEALPDDVLETLLTAPDSRAPGQMVTANEIRGELTVSGQVPQAFRRRAAHHPNPLLRAWATGMWLWLTPGQRDAFLADPDPAVREAALRDGRLLDPVATEAELPEQDGHHRAVLLTNYAVTHDVVERCLAERRNLWALAHNRHTPRDAVDRLARDPDPAVRRQVASRADTAPETLARLAEDEDDTVRARALVQPLPRRWEECAAIDRIIGRTAERIGVVAEMFVEPETAWYAECAVSPHPALRRTAATCRLLPGGLVDVLAVDPDADVRHLLAYHHPLAPSAIILEAFIATPRRRPHLLTLPGLPRTGLGHLLGHDDPDVRALAAADPGLARPAVHLLADPAPHVRRAAASGPLPPADLHDLLDLGGLP